MPTDVALAVLFGALLHATWNTLVKASADKLALTVLVCCAAALWSLPAVVLLPAPAPESWRFIAQSALIHLFYFSFVGLAYTRVDLSVAYPLMRGLPPLATTALAMAWLGETPGLTALAGRYFLNLRYETFLQPAQPAQLGPGEGGLATGSLRSEWLGALKSAEAARAQAVAQLADREARMAALYRGRTAFLTEIEALRLAAEETKFAHQAEIAALSEEIAQARDLVVQQSLETALVQDRLNQSQHVLSLQDEEIAAYARRIAELEARLGRAIAEMALG